MSTAVNQFEDFLDILKLAQAIRDVEGVEWETKYGMLRSEGFQYDLNQTGVVVDLPLPIEERTHESFVREYISRMEKAGDVIHRILVEYKGRA